MGFSPTPPRAKNLAKVRALLVISPGADASGADDVVAGAETAHPCPCCGGRMQLIEIFERGAAPRLAPMTTGIGIDSS